MVTGDETQIIIKVHNTKLGISTFWSMAKFENRLVQMRDLYNNVSIQTNDVFLSYCPYLILYIEMMLKVVNLISWNDRDLTLATWWASGELNQGRI